MVAVSFAGPGLPCREPQPVSPGSSFFCALAILTFGLAQISQDRSYLRAFALTVGSNWKALIMTASSYAQFLSGNVTSLDRPSLNTLASIAPVHSLSHLSISLWNHLAYSLLRL